MPGNLCFESTRAASITAAVPEPSSFAPGASEVKFMMSVTRLSIWPCDDDDVVGPLGPALDRDHVADRASALGMRAPVNVSHGRTVGKPKLSNWPLVQFSAAPMPRFGSVCDESVCRVPKPTSVSIVCRSCAWLTGAMIARSFASGDGGGAAPSKADAHQDRDLTHSTLPLAASATGICRLRGSRGAADPRQQN